MAYTPQTWANGEAGGTPLSAARLNYIEAAIDAVDSAIAAAQAEIDELPVGVTATEAQAFVNQKVVDLLGSAPTVMNTLGKIAASVNNDPTFAATVDDALATKVSTTTDVKLEVVTTLPANNPAKAGTIYVVRP